MPAGSAQLVCGRDFIITKGIENPPHTDTTTLG